jgi:hypothetical protein
LNNHDSDNNTMDANSNKSRTAGKKRKAKYEDDTSSPKGSSTLFIVSSFPDSIWESIAWYSSPPDVYNLALTSKYFHYTNSSTNDQVVVVASDKSSLSSPLLHLSSPPLLATRLLRKSLLSSFVRVLDNSGTGIDINAALQLSSELPKVNVLIAGSAIV